MTDRKHSINEDTRAVVEAANILSLREIDFFRLAYRRWFSNDATDAEMEKIFAAYMFHETVPPWVRHAAREVINRDAMGMLNAVEFGAGDFRRMSKVPRVGRTFLIVASLLMLAVYLSLLFTRHGFDNANCPGQYRDQFIMQWVYMIKGMEPPACEVEGENDESR